MGRGTPYPAAPEPAALTAEPSPTPRGRRCSSGFPAAGARRPAAAAESRDREAAARPGVHPMNGTLQPPGWTERVRAASALVLAPHHDDEVLGCGGLAAQLAAAGGAVRVLFLTDGGGGAEAVDGPRRLPPAAAGGGRQGLRDPGPRRLRPPGPPRRRPGAPPRRGGGGDPPGDPDPAPRAAARPLAAGGLARPPRRLRRPPPPARPRARRPSGPGAAPRRCASSSTRSTTPAYPDLLVDVGAERERLERAMAAYASQEERHPYWNAGARPAPLPHPEPAAGGGAGRGVPPPPRRGLHHPQPGPARPPPRRLARRSTRSARGRASRWSSAPATARACSPRRSTASPPGEYRRAEVVLVNDGGEPPAVPAGFPLPVVRVDLAENRGRAARRRGGHRRRDRRLRGLPGRRRPRRSRAPGDPGRPGLGGRGARRLHRRGGGRSTSWTPREGWVCRERRLPYSRDFDPRRPAGRQLHPVQHPADRARAVRRGRPVRSVAAVLRGLGLPDPPGGAHPVPPSRAGSPASTGTSAAAATTSSASAPASAPTSWRSRRGCSPSTPTASAPRRWPARSTPCAPSWSAEREGWAGARRDLADLAAELAGPGRPRRPLPGRTRSWPASASSGRSATTPPTASWRPSARSASSLRGELQDGIAGGEIQRLYDDEGKLRAAVDDQTAHLGRTYAEIERLNGIIREMEATRAWRSISGWGGGSA